MSKLRANNNKPGDDLQHYLTEIGRFPLLSLKDERMHLALLAEKRGKMFQECSRYHSFRVIVREELLRTLKGDAIENSYKLPPISDGAVEYFKEEFIDLPSGTKAIADDLTNPTPRIWKSAAANVRPTGNVSCYVIDTVKRQHSRILKNESVVESLRYFGAKTPRQVFILSRRALVDPCFLEVVVERAQRPKNEVLEKVRGLDDLQKTWRKVKTDPKSTAEIKALHAIIEKCEEETQDSRDFIVNSNLRLVVSRAKYKVGRGLNFDDLIEEGNLGLLKSVEKYDPTLNTRLSTYSTWWIDQSIQRAIQNKARIIKLPVHVQALISKISRERLTFEGRTLTPQELSDKLEVKVSSIEIALEATTSPVALHCELEGEDFDFVDLIQADETQSPYLVTEEKLSKENVREALAKLPPETEKIIRLKFGIGEPPQKMRAISSRMGMGASSVQLKLSVGLRVLAQSEKSWVRL